MSVQVIINQSEDPRADYIGWAPCPLQVSSTDGLEQEVILRNNDPDTGGQVVFMHNQEGPPEDSLQLTLPADGALVDLWIAGKFDQETMEVKASTNDKDTVIDVLDATTASRISEKRLMVRVRKNANLLSEGERDRFLSALVQLNHPDSNGVIKFLDFQNMHVQDTSQEVHRRSCFLPWHRAYLLDLERNLQAIDPSVSLPYWKFDEAAPFLFTKDFIGRHLPSGHVDFSPTNPLINWTPQVLGVGNGRIRRVFPPAHDPALKPAYQVRNNEDQTIGLGKAFLSFRIMEGDPHGSAHKSFRGQISDIGQAPADPLFFLLHCNVDRLWAKWQWFWEEEGYRYNPEDTNSYPWQGHGNPNLSREPGIGNFTLDTMWPWNGEFNTGQGDTNPRPAVAPGGPFPTSIIVDQPGDYPRVRDMIDFQGQLDSKTRLGFAYDDVPFDFISPPTL